MDYKISHVDVLLKRHVTVYYVYDVQPEEDYHSIIEMLQKKICQSP